MMNAVNTVTTNNLGIYTAIVPLQYYAQSSSYYYGGGDYNVDPAYNGTLSDQNSSGLINTGSVIWLSLFIASLLIISAIIIRIARRKESNQDETTQG